MKKIISFLLILLSITGCSLINTPTSQTKEYLNRYQNLDEKITTDLNTLVENKNYSKEQKDTYLAILKKQYQDLKYEIISEDKTNDSATVEVKIKVYDYYKIEQNTQEYLTENPDNFKTNEVYDESKFITYKLNQLKNASDRIEYTIEISLIKEDSKWIVVQPSTSTLEKIHGIYNYNMD